MVKIFDKNRFIGHKKKIELIKGNAIKTIPKYIKKNKELLVSLLFLDFDIYAPTVTALKYFLPRMSKGGIIAFDQVNNPDWKVPEYSQQIIENIEEEERVEYKEKKLEDFFLKSSNEKS